MIKADQPTIFDDEIICGVSSVEDGQMILGKAEPDSSVIDNRQSFLEKLGLSLERTTLVKVSYSDNATYDKIKLVSSKDGGWGMQEIVDEGSDCLVTSTTGLALFVPVADCGATVVYDPKNQVLALAHLGRHSTIAGLAKKLTNYLVKNFQTNPADLKVWISPSISPKSYILKYADFAKDKQEWTDYCKKVDGGYSLDNAGFNKSQFVSTGVKPENIQISDVDTAVNSNYWSHQTEVSVNKRPAPPRFAVVACLKNH